MRFLIASGEIEEIVEAKSRLEALKRFVRNNSDKTLGEAVRACEIKGEPFFILTENVRERLQNKQLKIVKI